MTRLRKSSPKFILNPGLPSLTGRRCHSSTVVRKNNEYLAIGALIFERKCFDLGITINEQAKYRFQKKILSSFHNKSILIGGLNFGPFPLDPIINFCIKHPKFVVLDLSHDRIGDEGAEMLSNFLSKSNSIISLDLSSNGISSVGVASLFRALCKGNSTLSILSLCSSDEDYRNHLEQEGSQMLGRLLRENKVLSELDLSMTGFSTKFCELIGQSLSFNQSLVSLNLSGNLIGMNLLKMFELKNSLGSLEVLILSKNELTDSSLINLSLQLGSNHRIEKLDLSDNHITIQFLKMLLRNGFHGSELNLSKNRLNKKTGDLISRMLIDSCSIKVLNISHNRIQDESISFISKALELSNLEVLDVSENLLGDSSAVSLSQALKNHRHLQSLNISSNNIGSEGGIIFFDSLVNNKVISKILIRNNELDEKCAPSILSFLQKSTSLTSFDVNYNDFDHKSLSCIQEACQQHKKLIGETIIARTQNLNAFLEQDEKELFKIKSKIKTEKVDLKQTEIDLNELQSGYNTFEEETSEKITMLKEELERLTLEATELREAKDNVIRESSDSKRQTDFNISQLNFKVHEQRMKKTQILDQIPIIEDRKRKKEYEYEKQKEKIKDEINFIKNDISSVLRDFYFKSKPTFTSVSTQSVKNIKTTKRKRSKGKKKK